jgi:Zn-dependent alcohol dehydrogenase
MGASTALVSTSVDLKSQIRAALGPRTADVVIDTTGASSMIELAYELATQGGRVVLVGVPRHDDPVSLDSLPLHFGMRLTGSKGGSVRPDVDVPRLIDLADQGIYRVDNLPVTEFALDDVNQGIGRLRDGEVGRIVVSMKG